jgi:hypothetical protein
LEATSRAPEFEDAKVKVIFGAKVTPRAPVMTLFRSSTSSNFRRTGENSNPCLRVATL